MASHAEPAGTVTFNLSGDSDDFRNKKTDVFGSLDAIELSYQSKLASRSESDNKRESSSRELSEEVDGNASFKRPRSPTVATYTGGRHPRSRPWTQRGRKNQKPDFEANPAKWTRYSLEDTDVCGNAQNSRVALGIIRDLKERREQEDDLQKADLSQKVLFSKPVSAAKQDKDKKYGDILRMDEYDFGAKAASKKAKVAKATCTAQNTSSVSLSFDTPKDEIDEHSDGVGQLDSDPGIVSQSETSKDTTEVPAAEPTDEQIESGQTVSVGFKKRKGQRNLRTRHSEDE